MEKGKHHVNFQKKYSASATNVLPKPHLDQCKDIDALIFMYIGFYTLFKCTTISNYCIKNETWIGKGSRSKKTEKLILVRHSEFAENIDQCKT